MAPPERFFFPGDREDDETGSSFTANMAHDLFAEVFGAQVATAMGENLGEPEVPLFCVSFYVWIGEHGIV